MKSNEWAAALVAVALISLVGAISVATIINYEPEEFFRIWNALGPILGVITGAIAGYFFTRPAVRQAQQSEREAKEKVEKLELQSGSYLKALCHIAGRVNPAEYSELVRDPDIAKMLRLDFGISKEPVPGQTLDRDKKTS